ncbi:MAG: alpha/beta hydrolase [Planctomycetes bacterium]|nr:alpha/beta hydrolase [Planctomycetota bacterium]
MNKQTIIYKHIHNCDIKLDVVQEEQEKQVDESVQLRAAIVLIHGGALINGSRHWASERAAELATLGYVVFNIDYRLAPQSTLPNIMSDIHDAGQWIVDHAAENKIDVQRIAVMGHSAGGYLTLMCGFCLPFRPQALISYYGYGDIVGDWYAKPDPFYCSLDMIDGQVALAEVADLQVISELQNSRPSFYQWTRQQGSWTTYLGGVHCHDDPDFFTAYCPIQNIDELYPPCLLLHGDADVDVPHQQSVMMTQALQDKQRSVEFISIKNGEHGFDHSQKDKPAVIAAEQRVLDFLQQYVGC